MYAFTIFCVEIEVFFFFFFSTIEIQKVNIKVRRVFKNFVTFKCNIKRKLFKSDSRVLLEVNILNKLYLLVIIFVSFLQLIFCHFSSSCLDMVKANLKFD